MHAVTPTCSYTTWEEEVQTVHVLHRCVSDTREGGEESGGESEEFLNVEKGKQTLK